MSSLTLSTGALALGVASHLLYFHRYECHMHGTTYLGTFLTAYAGGATALVKLYSWSYTSAMGRASSIALAYLIGAYGSMLIYRALFNPLNKFPGPYWARFSNLWLSSKLGNSDGYYFLQDLHKKYGNYVRIGSHDLSIIDPEAMEVAFGNKSKVVKADWYDGDAPLTSMHTSRDKELHDRRRRVWAPAFSPKALREYESEIRKFIDQLVDQIGKHEGKPVNVTKWFNLFSFDAMGRMAFGKDYGMLQSGTKPQELDLLAEGMQPLALRLPVWLFRVLIHIPGLAAGYSKFVQFCVQELTWRVKNTNSKSEGHSDIMSWLLEAYQGVPHPETDTMLQADARLIIVAGSDTTAAALSYLFFHLAQEPEQVRKLRDELRPLTQGDWQDADIRASHHLNGCINEALRLHPPVPSGLNRLTPPEGVMIGDTWIPGRTTFITPQYTMGRDESIYQDANTFLPERWYSQDEKVKHKNAFAPFSIGPMGCIGKNLALIELRTVTARLVLTYDVKFAPNEDGERILRRTKDHFTLNLGDLDLIFTPRAA